ncbi:AlpA family phage regulatory protein [Pseudomonas aeruginosa]|uniref:helix-turn-helix transcriptional regulator n=1 Tax=Pseudomonas aeruginosa TaxID=287 RepID=UPI0024125F19|nr:AlpA family phage regulatory protein [Pseudomonas aeruginosa]MDI3625143.1 AlpA family phage regulatory protein [Pseudomonas aeruginosa]HBP5004791.1 AlpA family phage regulatory protein [Pseudomonas aeruginosa]
MSAAEKIDYGEQFLTRKQVCTKLGFKSLTSLYKMIEKYPDFPKARKTGVTRQSATRYVRSEVDKWMIAHGASND